MHFLSANQTRRRVLTALSLLLLVSLACNFSSVIPTSSTPAPGTPGADSSNPTLTAPSAGTPATPASGGGKTVNREKLPPALVETDPPAGSRIAPGKAVTFYFNQAMQHSTVEAALGGKPASGGSFEWLGDTAVRFTPNQPYPAAAPLMFTIAAGATAANGLAFQEPVQINFETAGPLRVGERVPLPGTAGVKSTSALIVTFTDPVVELGADPGANPPAFTLQPEAAGKGEWINTSTYIFYPQPALNGGQTYTVTLNPGLKSSAGSALSLEGLAPTDWTFTTAKPAVLTANWGDFDLAPLDASVLITFNQPMDTANLEKNFRLVGPAGVPVAGKITWDDPTEELTFKPDQLLERGTRYTIQIPGASTGLGGTPLGTDFNLDFNTLPAFAVSDTVPPKGTPFNTGFGFGAISINFTSPLAKQNFASLVSVEPSVGNLQFYPGESTYTLNLQGAFSPSTTYHVRLSGDLRDRWGAALGQAVDLEFTSEAAPPSLVIPAAQAGGQIIYFSDSDTTLQARATNLQVIQMEVGRMDLKTFEAYSAQNVSPMPALTADYRWDIPIQLKPDSNEAVSLPLTPNRAALAPGLYYLKASSPQWSQPGASPYLLVVSHVQLSLKTGPGEVTAWAVDLRGQIPVSGAKITFYNDTMASLGECTTDSNGLCRQELPGSKEYYRTVYAVTSRPGDLDFGLASTTMNAGLAGYEFGIPTGSIDNNPMVYLYTDRPIYRPGQKVNFKAIVRSPDNGRYSQLALNELELKVLLPYDYTSSEPQALTSLRLPVSAYGTVTGSFDLPAGASPGYYSINIDNLPGAASLGFQVAEYRKPEFDLQAAFSKSDYLAGDPVSTSVSARYYFDAPAGDLAVTWTLYAGSDFLYLPGGLHTGPYSTYWLRSDAQFYSQFGVFIAQGSGRTAPDGKLSVEIPADKLTQLDPQQRQTLTFEVSAADESGLQVSSRTTALFHPASFYAGVRPESWGSQAGDELGFGIQTVDWQNQPSGNHSLKAVFSKAVWERKDPQLGDYGDPTYQLVLTQVGSTDFRTDGLGRARVTFTPPDPGVYQMEVKGEGALTQILVWIGGPGSAPWPSLPNQRLQLESDASEYSPGQTAKIRIPNPYTTKSLALITVERSRIMYQHVVELTGSMVEEQIPVDALFAPNAYVSVTILGHRDDGAPDFRQGYLTLKVKPDALSLNVSVKPSTSRALPGENLDLELNVTGSDGKPVQGEFSLALVDKAILALADPNSPDIFDAFYGVQPLGVATSLNLASYTARIQTLRSGGRGGGGGGDLQLAGARVNFQDTAAWYGAVETGPDGKATFEVKLPDNLTTWVADLRGLTGDTRVGQAEIEVVTTKDLLVRPVTPRFLVAGDHVLLGAIVQNNTPGSLNALVTLEAAGLTLETAAPSQQVDVPAGERRRVDWWVTVQDVAAVDPLFTVTAGNLRDSTRLEGGKLPVLRFKAPQTFATGGILSEAGERLELVSIPQSYQPMGGELSVELSPSLGATVLNSLEALKAFPDDTTEQIASRLLPNLAAYQALKQFNLQTPDLEPALREEIHTQLSRLVQLQNDDGGFSWNGRTSASQAYLSSYVLFTLQQASMTGFLTNQDALNRLRDYLRKQLFSPDNASLGWKLDQLAFSAFTLSEDSDQTNPAAQQALNTLVPIRERLSPWGKAFLALGLENFTKSSLDAKTILSDLQGTASRSATGASWQQASPDWQSWSTPGFTTAVVVYALARLDPAAGVVPDAVRYLVLSRQPAGYWKSSYETAWVLLALVQALQSTGDLQASFSYQAELNGTQLAAGNPQTPASALNPVQASVPYSDLIPDGPNALRIRRDAGDGRLYYRAFLTVDRPAESAPALDQGISVRRDYYLDGQDCRSADCKPITTVELNQNNILLVRVTVTVPQDMYYVVVEDTIPAGTEIINPNLKTSRQGFTSDSQNGPFYDPRDPLGDGWGWWYFGAARVFDQGLRWTAPFLAAGTYQLTYRLVPFSAGEFRVLPAHAYQNYFPDIQGTSAGSIFNIK